MKEQKIEEAWDKKKIIITLAILLALITGVIYFTGAYKIKGDNLADSKTKINESVKGVAEKIETSDIKEAVQQKIEEIKTEASNIDLVEIASSSPQVQKIINDIKALENYPSDQARTMCEKICDSF